MISSYVRSRHGRPRRVPLAPSSGEVLGSGAEMRGSTSARAVRLGRRVRPRATTFVQRAKGPTHHGRPWGPPCGIAGSPPRDVLGPRDAIAERSGPAESAARQHRVARPGDPRDLRRLLQRVGRRNGGMPRPAESGPFGFGHDPPTEVLDCEAASEAVPAVGPQASPPPGRPRHSLAAPTPTQHTPAILHTKPLSAYPLF